jgi:DNA polymerase III epsilon subunit-like protein
MVRWPSGYGPGPTFLGGRAPEYLRTRRQLRAEGLSAAGLRPAGWLQYNPHHAVCALYDRAKARPVRPLTDRQRAVLAAGRTLANTALCARCGQARAPWRPGWEDRSLLGKPYCDPCHPIEAAEREAARVERDRQAAIAFARRIKHDRATAASWAREVLTDPAAVVLDTESTGLYGAYLVEIAVIDVRTGQALLDTLVNPGLPIPVEAVEIHGITDDLVRDAPTFAGLLPQIEAVLSGRRVVIYNAPFDTGIIEHELCRLWCGPAAHDDYERAWLEKQNQCRDRLDAWTTRVVAHECAMEQHARWHGEWHPYWGDYTWQRLGGGHRAAGDCRTVIDRLREMAVPRGFKNSEASSRRNSRVALANDGV